MTGNLERVLKLVTQSDHQIAETFEALILLKGVLKRILANFPIYLGY
ncbi:MAG: hypothetical protein ACI8PB_003677 [Desulforhopalus sp.]|jgi:hypothetical protein